MKPLVLVASLLPCSPQSPESRAPNASRPDALIVRLSESSRILARAGELVAPPERRARLASLRRALRGAQVEALIRQPAEVTDSWHRALRAKLGEAAVHPARWLRVRADPSRLAALNERLRAQPDVAYCAPEPIPALPSAGGDIPPRTPDFTSRQRYQLPAPGGVDALFAHGIVGGRGRGVQVSDVEAYWNIPHEDACALSAPGVWLTRPFKGDGSHGNAVVGVLAADRNGYGVTGMVDRARIRIASWNDGGVPNAIAGAILASRPGDVIVVEAQYWESGVGWMPAEHHAPDFSMIQLATVLGIHVVEAAGNGAVDLDHPRFRGRFTPKDPRFRDSGAILVGASEGGARRAARFSNHGSRVDTNGWGQDVTTLGYGVLFGPNQDRRQEYTDGFMGTSSATAIVAGVVAQLVGAVRFQNGRILDPREVRGLLRAIGTPCSGGIGRRPDLRAMLAALGLPDGLWVAAPQARLGGQVRIELAGMPGTWTWLMASDRLRLTPTGRNRAFHLDASSMTVDGPYLLPAGRAAAVLAVPQDASLSGHDFFFQGLSIDPYYGMRLTSSAQVRVR